jgi:biopolymer transport protein ExbD
MARRTARREEGNDPNVTPMIDCRLLMMVLGKLLKLPLVAVWLVKTISVRLISSLFA